ncbi:hypothetical protein HYV84_00640 [Candidatus Woesearchaeota archaeon]|nr:hypothetical protein [Candidatus Woesearchaeota archaeon]
MVRKTVALSLEEEIYNTYRDICKKHHIILSRKVEDFMKDEIKRRKD